MIGRVDRRSTCPRCGLSMILIGSRIVTSGGLVDELWLCPRDGAGCDSAVALFPTAFDAFGAEESDDFAEELAELVRRWYREERNREERNREALRDAPGAIADRNPEDDPSP